MKGILKTVVGTLGFLLLFEILVVIALVPIRVSTGEKFNEDWRGEAYVGNWITVGLHKEPNDDGYDWINRGEKVFATGKRSYFFSTQQHIEGNYWSEVIVDGETAWIIGSAVVLL